MKEEFYELYGSMPRQGPGDNASTRRALALISRLPDKLVILDVGCGKGMQTLELARITTGKIFAVDNYQPFLDALNKRALSAGAAGRITSVNASMDNLPFGNDCFDVIWSEGAIFVMGFEHGLRYWRNFLRPGGYIAVTETTWFRDDLPVLVKDYWQEVYPFVNRVQDNLNIIESCGFINIGHFALSPSAWWADYYQPLLAELVNFRAKYAGNNEVLAIAEEAEREIGMHRQYADYYGYVFYVMKKPE